MGEDGDLLNFSYTEVCYKEMLSKSCVHEDSNAISHHGDVKHREIGTIRKKTRCPSEKDNGQPMVGLVQLNLPSCTSAMDIVRQVHSNLFYPEVRIVRKPHCSPRPREMAEQE